MRHVGFDENCGAIAEQKGIGVVKEIDLMELERLDNRLQSDCRRVSGIENPLNVTGRNDVIVTDSVKVENTGVDRQDFGIKML